MKRPSGHDRMAVSFFSRREGTKPQREAVD
jgi:hypothetical protein